MHAGCVQGSGVVPGEGGRASGGSGTTTHFSLHAETSLGVAQAVARKGASNRCRMQGCCLLGDNTDMSKSTFARGFATRGAPPKPPTSTPTFFMSAESRTALGLACRNHTESCRLKPRPHGVLHA